MKLTQWKVGWWWILGLMTLILGKSVSVEGLGQHRPGYGINYSTRDGTKEKTSDFKSTTTDNPLEGPYGYIILSMKDSTEDGDVGKISIGTSTARIQEFEDPLDTHQYHEYDENETTGIAEVEHLNKTRVDIKYMLGGYIRREIWSIPLISIILLNLFLISFFEIYVLCQAKGQGPLFLGQILLLGLFVCSALSFVFVVSPSSMNCYFGSFGISVSYALIFSVLMVKCVFLVSLDSGNHLPIAYQAFLLLFAVLVQIAINTQSAFIFPPNLYKVNGSSNRSFWAECGTDFNQSIWPMVSYNIILILIIGFLAIKTRRIRENYGESTYIGFSILITIPIWVCWIIAACIMQGRNQDAFVAFGCQAQSLSTFLIMFMPKGRQLATMGEGGKLLTECQDDEYSPSFYHFKPGKYYKPAVIDPIDSYNTFEAPTFSTHNPNVYFYRTDFHPGMIY